MVGALTPEIRAKVEKGVAPAFIHKDGTDYVVVSYSWTDDFITYEIEPVF